MPGIARRAFTYLGDVPDVGVSDVMLNQPYTLPAPLLGTARRSFTSELAGDVDDDRGVATVWDTRVASLTDASLELFRREWSAQWTRMVPPEVGAAAPAV